ncbi:MAG: surface-adhesin E family protein [Burkholderiales bacterium]
MKKRASCLMLAALLTPAITTAVEWRYLVAPGDFQSMVDMDSVTTTQGVQRFMLRREFNTPQTSSNGSVYRSARVHYVGDCASGLLTAGLTAYYGIDRKLVHSEQRTPLRRSDFSAPDASDVAEAMALACQRIAEGPPAASPKVETKPAPKPVARGSSSGSGIIVSEGQVLTNHHVVNECDAHEIIDGNNAVHKALLQVSDTQRDLALLTVDKRFSHIARVRSDTTPKLGEAITVVGYPLVNVLGSNPTVGFGHVSSTTGLRDSPAQMQISVPIQRGNSGGPVFDQSGNVIGVVVSKLDALKMAARVGDLPQNVNFAIRGEVMRLFLENNQVNFPVSRSNAKLENTDIASQGAAVTVRVRCIRRPVAPVAATQQ